jgi:HPt (histidine-containing phosphotransfer) domain-containing protein
MNFSLDYINEVTQNDSVSRNEIIQLFIDNLPEYLDELELSFEEKDLEGLKKSAHKLKASLFTLKAFSIINQLEFIELEVNQSTSHNLVENIVQELVFEIKSLIDQLRSQITIN